MSYILIQDPKIALKRKCLDKERLRRSSRIRSTHNDSIDSWGKVRCLTGDEWYSQSASRAVNQAIGRIIRHRYDFGCVILCDERFGSTQQQKQLSAWAQPYLCTSRNFAEAFGMIRGFFSTIACDTSLQNFAQSRRQLRLEKHTKFLPSPRSTLTEEYIPQASVVLSMQNGSGSSGVSVNGSYIPPSELADAAMAQTNVRATEELKLQEWRLREAGRRGEIQANSTASKQGAGGGGVTFNLFASPYPTGMRSTKANNSKSSRAPAPTKIFPKGAVPSLANQLREAGGGEGVSGAAPMPRKTTSYLPNTIRKHGDRVHQSLKFGENDSNGGGGGGSALYANGQRHESVNAASKEDAEESTLSANRTLCCDSSSEKRKQEKQIGREFLSDVRSQLSRRSTEEFAHLLRSLREETLNAEQGKVTNGVKQYYCL